jgi:polyphosphate kinase
VVAKMNGLVDAEIIHELYQASQAGVAVDLIIRGVCCLKPGVPGLSENIRVRSVVDRFLEHSRAYYFENLGQPELWLGSADWMPRNFRGRVEVLFPVLDDALKRRVISEVLAVLLADNVKARLMGPDGSWARAPRGKAEPALRAQELLLGMTREQAVPVFPLPALGKPK